MSFLYGHTTLPKEITQHIAQYTKPKTQQDYQDTLNLTSCLSTLFQSSTPPWNLQDIAYSNVFYQNIGYLGYSLSLGCIKNRNLTLLLVFDRCHNELVPLDLLLLDTNNSIVHHYSIEKKETEMVLAGFKGSDRSFYYNLKPINQLNTLEKNNWKQLLTNSTKLANSLLTKHLTHKIGISFIYIIDNDRMGCWEDIWDGWG